MRRRLVAVGLSGVRCRRKKQQQQIKEDGADDDPSWNWQHVLVQRYDTPVDQTETSLARNLGWSASMNASTATRLRAPTVISGAYKMEDIPSAFPTISYYKDRACNTILPTIVKPSTIHLQKPTSFILLPPSIHPSCTSSTFSK